MAIGLCSHMSHFTTEADELVSAASTGRVAKRAIDILLAMAALIVAAPLMIAIFAAIGAGRDGAGRSFRRSGSDRAGGGFAV